MLRDAEGGVDDRGDVAVVEGVAGNVVEDHVRPCAVGGYEHSVGQVGVLAGDDHALSGPEAGDGERTELGQQRGRQCAHLRGQVPGAGQHEAVIGDRVLGERGREGAHERVSDLPVTGI
ncbi:hypothetical protein ACFQ7W_27340 [Streptomyces niveus]|uniref:hypothetical protein n=1 Tax=Streptomyces niveus TaxID=193462 RepID=UPI0036C13858